jgi:hypothetical protein
MSLSEVFLTVLKVRRIVVIVSILAGAGSGYKYGPVVWHKAEAKMGLKTEAKAGSPASAKPVLDGSVTTNSEGIKLSNCDLGAVDLTNRQETCVSLGAGKDCVLTPNMIDGHNVQLTVTVESRNAKGRIHDLSITQVVTKSGKPFEVAVGSFSFSLTPNVSSE